LRYLEYFVRENFYYEVQRYIIYEVMKMLDKEYKLTPDTNYQQIIDNLNLPCH
jgi:hypothetical protein